MLKQRIITAIIMTAVVVLAILFLSIPQLAFFLLLLVVMGAWEWSRLSGLSNYVARAIYVFAVIFLALLFVDWSSLSLVIPAWLAQLKSVLSLQLFTVRDYLGAAGVFWAIALLWVKTYPMSAKIWGAAWFRLLMGLFILVPMWLALLSIRGMENGIVYIFILLGIVTAADTGAYFTGRAWGNAKLAPTVSPGKSWAGFWGGLVASLLFCSIIWLSWSGMTVNFGQLAVLSLATGLASVLGDLMESMVKRHAGIKDSGHLLPGHGGFMDRMDSMTAAAPIYALILLLVS